MINRILVADDELLFHKAILRQFQEQALNKDYEFVFAKDGWEALKILVSGEKFDLFLTDIRMPEMDGLALLSELNNRGVEVLAIVITAYGDMHNIRKAMANGAFDFLTKPVSRKDLERTIERGLQTAKLRNERAGDSLRVKVSELKKPHAASVLRKVHELTTDQRAKICNSLLTTLEVEDLEEVIQNAEAQLLIARQNRVEREQLEAIMDDEWQELIQKIPLSALENGYLEKRYSTRTLANGEEREYGPYYYIRWHEGGKLRGKLLGKEDPRSRAGFKSLKLKVTGKPETV